MKGLARSKGASSKITTGFRFVSPWKLPFLCLLLLLLLPFLLFQLDLNFNDAVSTLRHALISSKTNPNNNNHSHNDNNHDDGRSKYGYRRPAPPFPPLRRAFHNCSLQPGASPGAAPDNLGVPHLILIGAQKAGTSTWRSIMNACPSVVTPSNVRPSEPHFLDWEVSPSFRAEDFANETTSDRHSIRLCRWRQRYAQFFDMERLLHDNNSVAFEKTPAYMLYPNLPMALKLICPWEPKILASLRNPVDRAWSQYRMEHGKDLDDIALLVSILDNEIAAFIDNGLLTGPFIQSNQSLNHSSINESIQNQNGTLSLKLFQQQYHHFINYTSLSFITQPPPSPFTFPNITFLQYVQRVKNYRGNRKGMLYRGLYAFLLHPWITTFAPKDHIMILNFEQFITAEQQGNTTIVEQVLKFGGVNNVTYLQNNQQRQQRNTRRKMRRWSLLSHHHHHHRRSLIWAFKSRNNKIMPPLIRKYLELLFQHYNSYLCELLGDEWCHVWEYN